MGKRRRHFLRSVSIATSGVLIVGYVAYALLRPLSPINPVVSVAQPHSGTAVAAMTWPAYGEQAVGVVGSGILAQSSSDLALPTASVAKVLTALCVLQKMPLRVGEQGPAITITQTDVDTYNSYVARDGSVVPVQVGEQLSEYQALQALLLPSANNIADTLARWAFGSIDAYTTYANAYALKSGLTSVHITDPSGLDSATVGSAIDLTKLGEIAIQEPVIAEVVAQPTASIPVAGTISNVNRMLGTSGLVGIKTGNNDQDPGAFLFASKQTIGKTPLTIVGTIMGAPSLGTALGDSLPLIASTTANLHEITAVAADQKVASYAVPWQGNIPVLAKHNLTSVAWANEKLHLTNTVQAVTTTSPRNLGALYLKNVAGAVVGSTDLRLSVPIKQPSVLWRLLHPMQ